MNRQRMERALESLYRMATEALGNRRDTNQWKKNVLDYINHLEDLYDRALKDMESLQIKNEKIEEEGK